MENHLNDVIPISRTIMTFRKLHAGVQLSRFLRLKWAACLGSPLAISHWNYGSFFTSGTVLHRLSWKMMKLKDHSL